ncbi:MAG TPA: LOG family protein [Verrucomicrobiae bacterium]|nr:LOG family protein [Verrucomicrobiae bacterium]
MEKKPAKRYTARPQSARKLVARDKRPGETVKAYKNNDFLMSAEARIIRMQCEYLEPLTRLKRQGVERAIIFWGSARIRPKPKSGPDYFQLASDLAERLARWTVKQHAPGERYFFCCGGGPGIMAASSKGIGKVDTRLNVALNISLPFEQPVNDHVTPELAFEFHYFFMRKFWFMKLAEAMVVFPGGFGTFDELFEMLTLVQTGKARKMPFVLFGREFWNEVVNFEALARRGLISREDVENIKFADTVDEAFAHLSRELTSASP